MKVKRRFPKGKRLFSLIKYLLVPKSVLPNKLQLLDMSYIC